MMKGKARDEMNRNRARSDAGKIGELGAGWRKSEMIGLLGGVAPVAAD
jgi:hypothetical protein